RPIQSRMAGIFQMDDGNHTGHLLDTISLQPVHSGAIHGSADGAGMHHARQPHILEKIVLARREFVWQINARNRLPHYYVLAVLCSFYRSLARDLALNTFSVKQLCISNFFELITLDADYSI